MLASNPASILDQIFRRTGISLTQESTSGYHALVGKMPHNAALQHTAG